MNSKNIERLKRFPEHCTGCGCLISAKIRSLDESCPLKQPKWTAIELSKKNT